MWTVPVLAAAMNAALTGTGGMLFAQCLLSFSLLSSLRGCYRHGLAGMFVLRFLFSVSNKKKIDYVPVSILTAVPFWRQTAVCPQNGTAVLKGLM